MRSINAPETRSRRLYSADMIIPFATICLVSVWFGGASARVPPKFVKAVNGVGKALYAGRYGYSVVPIPPHILVQSNIARKEVHLPPRLRKKRRPPPRRPYANQFREYSPYKKKQRRPIKRPPPYDYYDDEEVEEEHDYEYEERPKKQKDFEDFVAQHSELYSSGYNPGRKKKYRDTEEVRKPNFRSGSRPSTKLYSAAINAPSRAVLLRDEDEEERPRVKKHKKRFEEEEEEEYDNVYHDRTYEAKQKRRERGTEEKEKEWSKPEKNPMEGWTPGDKPEWTQSSVNIRWIEPQKKYEGEKWIEPPEKWTEASTGRDEPIEPTAPSSWPEKWREPTAPSNWPEKWKEPTAPSSWPEKWKEPTSSPIRWIEPTPEEKTTQKPKRRKNKTRLENHKDEIVAQRVVGGMVQYDDQNSKFKQFDNVHEDGEIVYGSRIKDQKSWRKELDIGFGQGMELMNDKIAGWQVY